MDLRDLRYFETIAHLQHLGRASTHLHRTQPALTSSIRRLESDCGAALFEKSGRGIRLTEAGKVLLKWAQRMRFDVEDRVVDLAARKAAYRWTCRHDLGDAPRMSRALRLYLRARFGSRVGWRGVDVFHLDAANQIVGKYTYAGYDRPRLERLYL